MPSAPEPDAPPPAATTAADNDGSGPGFLDAATQAPQPWERLAAWLGDRGHAFAAAPPPRQFAGGMGNLNYLVELDGRPMVLRRPPAGPLPPGANDMAREYRVLSRLWREFPLAPRAHVFCDDLAVLGAPFFVMEYRPGLVVHGELPRRLAGEGAALSRMLVEVLAALHAVEPASVDLDTLGRPQGFLERAIAGWAKRARLASEAVYEDGAPPPAARELEAWLAARTIPAGGVSLLHNDYKLNNIVLDPARPTRPVALLDWDMCTQGDPLFDLATLLSYWSLPGDPACMLELRQMPGQAPGFLSRADVVALYAAITGRDVSDILFYRVLCLYKLAVVFLQLYAQHRRGTTADPRYGALAGLGDGVFAFAVEVANGRAF